VESFRHDGGSLAFIFQLEDESIFIDDFLSGIFQHLFLSDDIVMGGSKLMLVVLNVLLEFIDLSNEFFIFFSVDMLFVSKF
jgi:hypothetical protein